MSGHADTDLAAVPELTELKAQLAGIHNLVKSTHVYKSKSAAKKAGGVALSDIVALEKRLAEAISDFSRG